MNNNLDDFVYDLNALINRYDRLKYAEIIGAIELVKFDLMNEGLSDSRSFDVWNEFNRGVDDEN